MECDNCGAANPVVQLTTVVDNEMKVSKLCQECAAKKGLDPGPGTANAPLVDFLAQIGKGVGEPETGSARCPSCGLTSAQLRQVGRLGCASCYGHFDHHLRSLLRRLHGATSHVGKVAHAPDAAEEDRNARIRSLRTKMEKAVQAQDFEHAAALRDQIRAMESGGGED